MADSQMRRTDSEETLMLPGRDGQPEQQQEPPCPGRDGQPEQQQEPPCSQPYASDHDEETFSDTDPSSQLDEDLQHYSLGGMTVAVQNSPSPMAFMLAGVVAQMMQPEKGNGKGKMRKVERKKMRMRMVRGTRALSSVVPAVTNLVLSMPRRKPRRSEHP